MPTFLEGATQLAANKHGTQPPTAQQQSFVQPGATTQGSQKQDPVLDSLDSMKQALAKSGQQLQKAQQNQFTQELQMKLKQTLLQNPAIQQLIKLRGQLENQAQSFDTSVQGNENVRPTQQGAVKGQALGSILQNLSDSFGTIQSQGQSVNGIIEGVAKGQEQQVQQAKDYQGSILNQISGVKSIQGIQQGQQDMQFNAKKQPLELLKLQSEIDKNNNSGLGAGSNVVPGDSKTLSPLAQSVLSNPTLFSQPGFMTPTKKQEVTAELIKYGVTQDQLFNMTLPELNATTKTDIAGLEIASKLAGGAYDKLQTGKFGTGMFQSRYNEGLAIIGQAPEGWLDYASMTSISSAKILKEISGVAVTPTEFERLRPFVPNINDPETTASTKLSKFQETIQEISNERKIEALKTSIEFKGETKKSNTKEKTSGTLPSGVTYTINP